MSTPSKDEADAFTDVFGNTRGASAGSEVRWENAELLWNGDAYAQGKPFAVELLNRFLADDGDNELVMLLNASPIEPAREDVPIPLDDYPVVEWLIENITARMDLGWLEENCSSLWKACFPWGMKVDKRDELVEQALGKMRASAVNNLCRYVSRGAVRDDMLHHPRISVITISAHISEVFGPYLHQHNESVISRIIGDSSGSFYKMDEHSWRAFARKWNEWYDGDVDLAKIKAKKFIRENALFS